MTAVAFVRPAWEVADVIREHGDAFPGQVRSGLAESGAEAGRCVSWPFVGPPLWAVTYKRLSRLRPRADRLQFVPQPPLPQVPGSISGPLAGASDPALCCPGRVFPRRVHVARGALGALVQANARLPCMRFCCRRRHKPCGTWPPTRSVLGAPRSACCWCCTPGVRTCTLSSARARGGYRRRLVSAIPKALSMTSRDGCRVVRDSSCRYESLVASSGASSWSACVRKPTREKRLVLPPTLAGLGPAGGLRSLAERRCIARKVGGVRQAAAFGGPGASAQVSGLAIPIVWPSATNG